MDATRAVAALGALAQETRLDIFRILVKAGPEGLAAGTLAEDLAVPSPTLSFHLQQLNHAGLITKRRDSRSLIYSVSITGINELMSFLTQDCCGGRPELCSPAAAACGPKAKPVKAKARAAARRRS